MNIAAALKRNQIKGGEIVSQILASAGVAKVFGIIDGTYFGMYSTLGENGIDLVSPRDETCAVYMAGAYARLTGELGVCIASNGPGVANALPGVAVENAEGNRVLFITSSRREGITYPDRGGAFQYFPQIAVTSGMTKWSCAVTSADRIAEIMRRALRLSFTGRPGVVHIEIPENIMNGSYDSDPTWFREAESYRQSQRLVPAPTQVKAAADLLRRAKKPIIHIGSGLVHSQASKELDKLAELLCTPVTTSWGARCALDERMQHAIPMIAIDTVNRARTEADLVLVLGSRLGETDWWGKAPYWGDPSSQELIQVDLDPSVLGCNRPADVAIQADVREFLLALLAELQGPTSSEHMSSRRKFQASLRKEVLAKRKKLDKHLSDASVPMHSAHVPTICSEVFEDDAIIVMDGGNTAVWANFYSEVRKHAVLGTPKMGMLGAGVAQALGAKVACPKRQVYCIIGDGAMGFHQQEIETAVRNKLAVIYLVLCDKQWGMVKMNQQFMLKPIKTLIKKQLSPDETINADLCETRFDDLARSMGAYGERVADPKGLRGAIERAQQSGRCAVIHVDVNPVKHLWAPHLKTFSDMHQEPSGVPKR